MIQYKTPYDRWLAEEVQAIKNLVEDLLAKSERIESVTRRTLKDVEKQNAKAEGVTCFKPWHPGLDMEGVTISERIRRNGGPKEGDLVAVDENEAIVVITWEDFLSWKAEAET